MKNLKNVFSTTCVLCLLVAYVNVHSNVMPLTAEIRNEQPYSLDNNAIRVRIYNHGADTLREMSFCYRFHADGDFVFEPDWYLPDLNYKVDSLADNTYQIHFWLKQNAFIAPNSYFPNSSGIVFGLHYKYWFAWEHQLDYSFSSNPSFENTDKLFLSVTNECYDEALAPIDTVRIKILGYDRDGNGVRDDLDSLIDSKLSDSPEKRAAYRYLAQTIQNQWIAFYDNPQMTYEELLSYEVYASLGATFVDETDAEAGLNWKIFEAQLLNTKDRVLFDDKIDRVFVGRFLPVAVGRTKQYPDEVAEGRKIYSEILKLERMR